MRRNPHNYLILLFVLSTLWSNLLWSSDRQQNALLSSVQMKTQGDTLSFELTGQNDWNYDLKRVSEKNQTKVLLTVKGIENESYDRIKNIKNPFIKNVKVSPNGVDGKKQIEFTLVNNKVETFDYLTDYPSKLIVDFYFNETFKDKPNGSEKDSSVQAIATNVKKQKIVKTTAKKAPLVGLLHRANPQDETAEDQSYFKNFKNDEFDETNKVTVKQDIKSKVETKKERKLASEYLHVADFDEESAAPEQKIDLQAGLFNVSDDQYVRFKLKSFELKPDVAHKEAVDYFIGYPLLNSQFGFWTKMKENMPSYQIQPEKNDENKQMRLIKKLYDKKRTLVLRQTTDWFSKKYPQSKYLEIAYAMTADRFIQDWQEDSNSLSYDLAQEYYKKLLDQYPQSALFERTSLAVGFYEVDKKNYLSAIRKFKIHADNAQFQNNDSKFYADLGTAYCLNKLNKTEEAIKIIDDVEKQSKNMLIKSEAAYKKADFLMTNELYSAAKVQYELAEKNYSQYAKLYPNGLFNKMEALFRLDMNVESHAAALDFLQTFPYHDFAPYAMTRLGELLEILGAPQEKAVGAYLETHFRYGDSPKTVVARLHLLSTRMKGMKDLELQKTIEKMNELAERSDLDNIQQFKTTMISDGYVRRHEYDKAIQNLISYYQESPSKKNSEQVTNRIKNNINSYIQFLSENNKNKDVLKIYKQYADNWIRNQERSDTFFYLGKAYQSAGAYSEALKKYELAEQKIISSRFPASDLDKLNAPKLESVRLAKAQAFYEQNNLLNSEKDLDTIKNPDTLTVSEQIARVNLASQLYEKKGDNDTAIRYLSEVVRVWKAQPNLVVESAIRVAKLWNKVEKPQKGIELLDNLLQEKLTDDNANIIYKTKSDIAMESKLSEVAINSLSYMINPEKNKLAASHDLSREKYQLGELYFQKGEIKKAEDVWSSFAEKDDKFWSQLANEKMKSAKWQDEYKKYLKRIPAAVGVQ